jgi:ATP-dependent Lhr-like helicase
MSIVQTGGATATQLFELFCAPNTPFARVSKIEFLELLEHLGEKDLITQDSSGVLLLGSIGERFVNHYSFYAAFAADEPLLEFHLHLLVGADERTPS